MATGKIAKKLRSAPDIYLVPFPEKTDKVYLDIYFKEGNYDEEGKEKGLTHMLEHYLTTQFAEVVDYAVETNGRVGPELTSLYIETSKKRALKDMHAFVRCLFAPDFTKQSTLDTERLAIINELNTELNSTDNRVFYALRSALFGKESPTVNDGEREIRNVKGFTLRDLERKYQKLFSPRNMLVTIGAYQPSKVLLKNIADLAQSFKPTTSSKIRHQKPTMPAGMIKHVPLKGRYGTYIILAFPTYSLHDPLEKRVAQSIFCRAFTHPSNNEVFRKLRERGIYGVTYDIFRYSNFGLVTLSTHVENGKEQDFVDVIVSGLEKARKNGFPEKRREEQIKRFKESVRVRWENNDERYGDSADDLLFEKKVYTPTQMQEILKKVDDATLKNIAGTIFGEKKMNIVTVGTVRPRLKI